MDRKETDDVNQVSFLIPCFFKPIFFFFHSRFLRQAQSTSTSVSALETGLNTQLNLLIGKEKVNMFLNRILKLNNLQII